MHYFSTLFGKELYMFRTGLMSIIRSLYTVFTATGICHTSYVACLLERSGWNCTLTFLADGNIASMTNTYCCEYSIKTPDGGHYVCPKHVEIFTKINLGNSVSRWFLLGRDHWGDPDVDGRIILRWIFRKWEGGAWNGLIWLRIGTGGKHS